MRRGILLTVALLAAGCVAEADPRSACDSSGQTFKLGTSFHLRYGNRATIASEQLSLTFENASGESRCPRGAQCIWEGNVEIALKAERPPAAPGSLELNTSQRNPTPVIYQGYEVQLIDVRPYPEQGRKLEPSEYCVELKVVKIP